MRSYVKCVEKLRKSRFVTDKRVCVCGLTRKEKMSTRYKNIEKQKVSQIMAKKRENS